MNSAYPEENGEGRHMDEQGFTLGVDMGVDGGDDTALILLEDHKVIFTVTGPSKYISAIFGAYADSKAREARLEVVRSVREEIEESSPEPDSDIWDRIPKVLEAIERENQ